ncbi:MAG: hypothetical protein ABIR46_04760 [Candidatus Saccharimonadales bacterium]
MNHEYIIPHTDEVVTTSESFRHKAKKFTAKAAGVAILASGAALAVHEARDVYANNSQINIDFDLDKMTGGSER